MINELIFAIIFSFIFNILLFILIPFQSKTIISLITSLIIFYIVFKNSDELTNYQNGFTTIMILILIIMALYKFIEYLIIYGLNSTYSLALILFGGLGIFILINFYFLITNLVFKD